MSAGDAAVTSHDAGRASQLAGDNPVLADFGLVVFRLGDRFGVHVMPQPVSMPFALVYGFLSGAPRAAPVPVAAGGPEAPPAAKEAPEPEEPPEPAEEPKEPPTRIIIDVDPVDPLERAKFDLSAIGTGVALGGAVGAAVKGGAMAGGAAGTMVFPGIGTAIGAGAGAVVGLVSGELIIRRARRHRTRKPSG
ncbi:MAG: hypothetical protein JO240_09715 [Solirubrobacterales bacterium]|nr:hypothetical protein [Solirubrobacterales bacterium]